MCFMGLSQLEYYRAYRLGLFKYCLHAYNKMPATFLAFFFHNFTKQVRDLIESLHSFTRLQNTLLGLKKNLGLLTSLSH